MKRRQGKPGKMESSVNFAIALLLPAVLAVWTVFALFTFNSMARQAERNAEQMSRHVIDVLEDEFLALEQISVRLSQSGQAGDFVMTGDALAFHEKAPAVAEYIDMLAEESRYIDSLILYGGPDRYYRFIGGVSNTGAAKAYYAAHANAAQAHMAVSLEGIQYVGYATDIYSGGQTVGKAVLLMDEGRILAMLDEYAGGNALNIALAADGRVLISPNEALLGSMREELEQQYAATESRRVGHTPFEIVVTRQSGYLSAGVAAFAVSALFTALVFGILLAVYARYMRRHFFTPVLQLMQGVKELTSYSSELPHYGEAEIDELADTINVMVRRLDERSQALLNAQAHLQEAEIERQRALIISLKKQINAHFTVNVLNDIKILAGQGEKEKAAEMSDGLSHLLRYANDADEFIGGMEELFILEHYVAIMRIRYGDAFLAEFDWDDRLHRARFPRMLIQPLVENAITHGLVPRRHGGALTVTAILDGDMVVVSVADNGAGMAKDDLNRVLEKIHAAATPAWNAAGVERIALANIYRRLWSYYGENFTMVIDSRENTGTQVRLTFPKTAEP